MNETIKNALILFAITLVSSVILGAVYSGTKDTIAQVQIEKRNEAFEALMPGATFEEMSDVDLSSYDKISAIFEAKNGDEVVGHAFQLVTLEGYGGEVDIVTVLDNDGVIQGIDVIKASETPGLGANADLPSFKDQYIGKTSDADLEVTKKGATKPNEIDTIGGATITSKAVTGAVNEAIDYYNDVLKKEGK